MNQETNEIQQHTPIDLAQSDHLLKEYELCFQTVQLNNTRLWTSASIFVSGSFVALAWLGARPLAAHNWSQFFLVATGALLIIVILGSYLKVFRSWEVLDRIQNYRAEEIEQYLKLWRIRYQLCVEAPLTSREDCTSSEDYNKRLDTMRKKVADRLRMSEEDLPKFPRTNRAFRVIIYTIIAVSILVVVKAFAVTLAWSSYC